jgi:hypothetical protein
MALTEEQLQKLQELNDFKNTLPVSTGQQIPIPKHAPIVEESYRVLGGFFTKTNTKEQIQDKVGAAACKAKRENFAIFVDDNKEFFESSNNWCNSLTHTWHADIKLKGESSHRYFNDGTYFKQKKSSCILQSQQADLTHTDNSTISSSPDIGLNIESLFLNFCFDDFFFFPIVFLLTFCFTYKLFLTIYKDLTKLNLFFAVLVFILLFNFMSIIFSYSVGLIAFFLAIVSSNIIIAFIGWNL